MQERRILVEELIARISVFPDHLQVTVSGAPPLHVLYQAVGLKQSDSVDVCGRDLIELSREDPIHPWEPLHQNGPDRILLESDAGRPLVSGRVGRNSDAPECRGCPDLSLVKGTAKNGPVGPGAKSTSGPTGNVSRCHRLGRAHGQALWIIWKIWVCVCATGRRHNRLWSLKWSCPQRRS